MTLLSIQKMSQIIANIYDACFLSQEQRVVMINLNNGRLAVLINRIWHCKGSSHVGFFCTEKLVEYPQWKSFWVSAVDFVFFEADFGAYLIRPPPPI